jgi:kinesin family protein 3/17
LTRILEDSLGGNCKTTMMAMITPSADAFAESLSTLKFATRAKKIKNEARINEDVDQRALLRKYEIELRKLKQELQQKENLDVFPELQKMEEERRRAEIDKNAAISALEQRSQEFMHA